jgi:ubiquinone/menaquinone biosynthesis C-methylase UbiE
MDFTDIDPQSAVFACRGLCRTSTRYYEQFVSWMPAGASRVLDVGSGTGTLALRLAERASFVIGVDTSPTMMALARRSQTESHKTNVAWVIASADALPFRTATFDYITSSATLRLFDLHRSLPELRRTIKPGGRIAIRDLVSPPPCFGFWFEHGLWIKRLMPKLLRLYGVRGTWRIVAYQVSPEGAQNARRSRGMDASSFMEIYRRYFPEEDRRFIFSPGKLFWQDAPECADIPQPTQATDSGKKRPREIPTTPILKLKVGARYHRQRTGEYGNGNRRLRRRRRSDGRTTLRAAESARPVRQRQRKKLQYSPTAGSALDSHTTGQRIHESKAGADQPPANAQSAAPNGSRQVSPGPEMR